MIIELMTVATKSRFAAVSVFKLMWRKDVLLVSEKWREDSKLQFEL